MQVVLFGCILTLHYIPKSVNRLRDIFLLMIDIDTIKVKLTKHRQNAIARLLSKINTAIALLL